MKNIIINVKPANPKDEKFNSYTLVYGKNRQLCTTYMHIMYLWLFDQRLNDDFLIHSTVTANIYFINGKERVR